MELIELGLTSVEEPKLQEWGDKRHVPINIEQYTEEDENGEQITKYRYDLIKRVEQPISYETILKAAVNAKFTSAELTHIMTNLMIEDDELVVKYRKYVTEMANAIQLSGYTPSSKE